jgi:ABC-type uncharacterized transport system permease subunit
MVSIVSLRRHRVFGIAIFDLVSSFIGVITIFLLVWRLRFQNISPWNFVIAGILLTIPIGIFFHIIFGVDTRLNSLLGLSNPPSR